MILRVEPTVVSLNDIDEMSRNVMVSRVYPMIGMYPSFASPLIIIWYYLVLVTSCLHLHEKKNELVRPSLDWQHCIQLVKTSPHQQSSEARAGR